MPPVMPYPENQLWALALAAVITELDGAHHDGLGGWGDNPNTRPWCKNRLKEFYAIESTDDLRKSASYFYQQGHTQESRETLASLPDDKSGDDPRQALVRENREEIARSGVLAWDTARVVAICGWGAWAGYMPELEAWEVMLTGAVRAQSTYDSWESYAKGYELGRLYWSEGKEHPPTARALEKLLTDPKSPWKTLPWKLDLGVTIRAPAKTRFKHTPCATCGAPKQRPSATAYIYCDYCGSLSGYDFAKACEKPLARPGPVYEQLAAELAPEMADALAKDDRAAYRASQVKLFDAYVNACADAVPPRVKDPVYRARYVAYMAEGATVSAFDEESRSLAAAVAEATKKLAFVELQPGVVKVKPATFQGLEGPVFAQLDHAFRLHEAKGVLAMQPDGASPEVQKHMTFSMFTQGWLPMLDEKCAIELLTRTGLRGEYVEADPPAADAATCGACGGELAVFKGARRMICERCGQRLDVEGERVRCSGCGAGLAPAEGSASFACPHCKVVVERVAMMKPARAL
jgi:DNA-directed RNA polymerase subunit RPC12/RpoP